MIQVRFKRSRDGLLAFSVSGHAGYEDAGRDIVCAAVTSAVQLASNGITEVLGVSACVEVKNGTVELVLPQNAEAAAYAFMQALYLHLEILSQDYQDYVKLTVLEV